MGSHTRRGNVAHPSDFHPYRLAMSQVPEDAVEYSVSLGRTGHSSRLAHYYDVRRHGVERAGKVREAFAHAADAIGITVPDAVWHWLRDENLDGALQLATGIDARGDETTRMKLYVIGDNEPCGARDEVCALAGADPQAAENAHIVAVDLTREGLHDVKIYHALDPERLERVVAKPWLKTPLFRSAQDVIFQHSLIQTERRRLHVRVERPSAISELLEGLPSVHFDELSATIAELEAENGIELRSWLLAFDYERGRLSPRRGTVYLHPWEGAGQVAA